MSGSDHTPEASMDDILASIRRIITEDPLHDVVDEGGTPGAPPPPKTAPSPSPDRVEALPGVETPPVPEVAPSRPLVRPPEMSAPSDPAEAVPAGPVPDPAVPIPLGRAPLDLTATPAPAAAPSEEDGEAASIADDIARALRGGFDEVEAPAAAGGPAPDMPDVSPLAVDLPSPPPAPMIAPAHAAPLAAPEAPVAPDPLDGAASTPEPAAIEPPLPPMPDWYARPPAPSASEPIGFIPRPAGREPVSTEVDGAAEAGAAPSDPSGLSIAGLDDAVASLGATPIDAASAQAGAEVREAALNAADPSTPHLEALGEKGVDPEADDAPLAGETAAEDVVPLAGGDEVVDGAADATGSAAVVGADISEAPEASSPGGAKNGHALAASDLAAKYGSAGHEAGEDGEAETLDGEAGDAVDAMLALTRADGPGDEGGDAASAVGAGSGGLDATGEIEAIEGKGDGALDGEAIAPVEAAASASARPASPEATGQPELPVLSLSSTSPAAVRSLEDTVAELLKPMLQKWLDDNMPRIIAKAMTGEELAAVSPAEDGEDA